MVKKLETANQTMTEVFQRQKGLCALCGKVFDSPSLNGDKHFIALSKTANDEPNSIHEELTMLCNVCQHSIQSKLLSDNVYHVKRFAFPHASFEKYGYADLLADMKDMVEQSLADAGNINDLKSARNILRDAINTLKTANLEQDDFSGLVERLNTMLEDLNNRQSQQNKKNEEEYTSKLVSIKEKIDATLAEVDNSNDFRKSREMLVALQNELVSSKLRRENHDELSSRLIAAFESLNIRQSQEWERYEMECSENYFNLKPIVQQAVLFADGCANFNQAREALIKAQGEFKGLKLKKEHREELFSQIQNAFERLNERQRAEREIFEKEANENFAQVNETVNAAIEFAKQAEIFKQAREALINAQNVIKNLKLKREQRDELYERIRAAFNDINERQTVEMQSFDNESAENYQKLTEKLDAVSDDIENTTDFALNREKLIAIQSEIKLLRLRKEHRQELFTRVRQSFAAFDNKRKEHRERINKEKLDKLTSIKQNLENKIERLEDSIGWDVRSLEYQREKLAKTVEDENPEAYKEIVEIIESIEARIKDKNSNIEEIRSRIVDIQNDLDKML